MDMDGPDNNSLLGQLRRVIKDGVDYAAGALRLLQAQVTAMALSSVAFLLLVFFAVLAGIVAFVLFSVAFGIWLTHAVGSAGCAILIIGGVYSLLALVSGGVALRWLKRLNS